MSESVINHDKVPLHLALDHLDILLALLKLTLRHLELPARCATFGSETRFLQNELMK